MLLRITFKNRKYALENHTQQPKSAAENQFRLRCSWALPRIANHNPSKRQQRPPCQQEGTSATHPLDPTLPSDDQNQEDSTRPGRANPLSSTRRTPYGACTATAGRMPLTSRNLRPGSLAFSNVPGTACNNRLMQMGERSDDSRHDTQRRTGNTEEQNQEYNDSTFIYLLFKNEHSTYRR